MEKQNVKQGTLRVHQRKDKTVRGVHSWATGGQELVFNDLAHAKRWAEAAGVQLIIVESKKAVTP